MAGSQLRGFQDCIGYCIGDYACFVPLDTDKTPYVSVD